VVVAAAGGEAISVVVLGALGEIKSTGSEVVGAAGGNTSGVETVVDEVGKAGGGSSVVVGSEAAKSLVVCTSTGNGLVSGKGCVAEGEDVSCVEVGAATGGGTSTGSDD
jgi:hypothetical protein